MKPALPDDMEYCCGGKQNQAAWPQGNWEGLNYRRYTLEYTSRALPAGHTSGYQGCRVLGQVRWHVTHSRCDT